MTRCSWVPLNKKIYVDYHDFEWGVPVKDDTKLFEFLSLELSQAGLSWYTILLKRSFYRNAFKGFDIDYVSTLTFDDLDYIIQNYDVVKNKKKLSAIVQNGKVYKKIIEEKGSFYQYILEFLPNKRPLINSWSDLSEVPKFTGFSKKISLDLKKRGMFFVGPTIIYSFLQATGFVNDHLVDCFRYTELKNLL
ncbi:MAG: DNA-3-methyladenine glycosylase I [Candidatus Dojkabacteria bacterium]|nr:MAG: DNA-3-methyladenine glycosylase I [Candidatus Dojkabacteria bacterium]